MAYHAASLLLSVSLLGLLLQSANATVKWNLTNYTYATGLSNDNVNPWTSVPCSWSPPSKSPATI